jgi:pimeloyl-ACP methyl ester carboxylesterase
MKKRTALLSAGVAAGAVVAGIAGRAALRRRHDHEDDLMGDPPPENLGFVESFDGTKLAVRAAGDPQAPSMILAHGFSLDMTIWNETWPELANGFRVVTFDHRSHGASDPAAHGDLSVRAMGRDLAAVLEQATSGRAVVVGHSMGGVALLALAELRPELLGDRVAGVVLIGVAASDLLRGAMGSVTEMLRPRLGSLRAAADRVDRLRRAVLASPGDVSGAVARITQFGPDAPHSVVRHVVHLAERTASEVWTDALPGLMEVDLRHAVARVNVPALVVVGEYDRVTPPAIAVELASSLPEGRLVVVDGAGHIPMLERPATLSREIAAFALAALAPTRRGRRKKEGAA